MSEKECHGHCRPPMQQHLCSANSYLAYHTFSHLLPILQHVGNDVSTAHGPLPTLKSKHGQKSETIIRNTYSSFHVLVLSNVFTSCSMHSSKLLEHSPFSKSLWCQLQRSTSFLPTSHLHLGHRRFCLDGQKSKVQQLAESST